MKIVLDITKGMIGGIIVLPLILVLTIRYFSIRKAVSTIGGWALKLDSYVDRIKQDRYNKVKEI